MVSARTLFICILSAFCFIVILSVGAEARDIHVDKDDANPTIQLGSEDFPYDSIDEAVNAANDDDFIYIHNSEEIYDEHVWVEDADRLTIIGDSTDGVIVYGDFAAFTIFSNGHVIERMTIRGDNRGIGMNGANTIIRDCVFQVVNISIRDMGQGNEYVNNRFENCDYAFYLSDSAWTTIRGSTFQSVNNTIAMIGRLPTHYDHNIAEDNIMDGKPTLFYRNLSHETITFDSDNHTFLAFYDCDNLTFIDMEVSGVDTGLIVAYSQDIEIRESSFTNNNWMGVQSAFNTRIDIIDVDLSGNNRGGLYCVGTREGIIQRLGTIDADYGITLDECHDLILFSITFTPGVSGIGIYDCYNIELDYLTVNGGSDIGIQIIRSHQVTVDACVIKDLRAGISVDECTNVTIWASSISGCDYAFASFDCEPIIEQSTIRDNDLDLWLYNSLENETWFNTTIRGMTDEIGEIEFEGKCSLVDQNVLILTIEREDGSPIEGAEVFVRLTQDGEETVVYATPHYGGTDDVTIMTGIIYPLPLTYQIRTESSVTTFGANLSVWFDGVEEHYEFVMDELIWETITLDGVAEKNIEPSVAITSPDDDDELSGTIVIEGTADDPNDDDEIELVEVRIDNGPWEEAVGTDVWEFEFDTTELPNGSVTIEARAFDGDLYSEIEAVEATISNGGDSLQNEHDPIITIEHPLDQDEVSGVITVSGTAGDEDGNDTLLFVEVSIDGGEWVEATGTSEWEYELDSTSLPDGTTYIEAWAYDGERYSAITVIGVIVANGDGGNTPPEAVELVLVEDSFRQGDDIFVSGKVHDADGVDDIPASGIALLVIDGSGNILLTVNWPILTVTERDEENALLVTYTLIAGKDWSGGYSLKLTVEDQAGETAETSVSFMIEEEDDDDEQIIDGIDDEILFFGIIPAFVIGLLVIIAFVAVRGKGSGSAAAGYSCPTCGSGVEYMDEYEAYYCWECEEYL